MVDRGKFRGLGIDSCSNMGPMRCINGEKNLCLASAPGLALMEGIQSGQFETPR